MKRGAATLLVPSHAALRMPPHLASPASRPTSARGHAQVKDKTVGIMLLARVPVSMELWPEGVEDYSFNLQTASNIIAPPTIVGELMKLDKGPAIEHLQKKHHLRPFLLDVYRVDYHFDDS